MRAQAGKARLVRVEERKALSRRLHDQLGQVLVALRFELHRLVIDGRSQLSDGAAEAMTSTLALADQALMLVRTLSIELRHPDPSPVDLAAMLEALFHGFTQRWRLRGRFFATGGPVRVDGDRATLVADVIREALTNVVRHTRATAVTLNVERAGSRVLVRLDDNGNGMPDPSAMHDAHALGLLGMRERAEQLGGMLDITSRAKDGTTITLIFPVRRRVAGKAGEDQA